LVGAVTALSEAGYTFPRIAGSSAGAVVGAVVAAMQAAGAPLGGLADIVRTLDYRRFRDKDLLSRLTGPLGEVASLVLEDGIYEGNYLTEWLRATLADHGVRTFADLRLPPDPGGDLAPEHRYRLVVTAADVSRRRLARLPWDYPAYGLDPDEQEVATAVRASASIPFFFEPARLRHGDGQRSTLLDGGLLSDFPIALFDRTDGHRPRWPTVGVRLSAREATRVVTHDVGGPLSLTVATVETLVSALDAAHIDDPCTQVRTVFVDTSGTSPVDFDISPQRQEELYAEGHRAALDFLTGWDFEAYVRRCRTDASR
jgi:NTE family protein